MIQGLAKRLQIARINKELSRKQTAERIGVSESLIGLYESGSRQPSLSIRCVNRLPVGMRYNREKCDFSGRSDRQADTGCDAYGPVF